MDINYDNIDLLALRQKNAGLVAFFKDALISIIRYNFKGQTFPEEIREGIKVIMPRLQSLKIGEILTIKSMDTQSDEKIVIKEILCTAVDLGWKIKYKNLSTQQEHTIKCNLIKDPTRSEHDTYTREIEYDGQKYRPVPYNGDVYNHLLHQDKRFQEFINKSIVAGVLSEVQGDLYMLFHDVHDLPEITKGDTHVLAKDSGHADTESHIIEKLIKESQIEYSAEEINLIKLLFSHMEKPNDYFKVGEILNYLRDAINIFKRPEYYHGKQYFAAAIIMVAGGMLSKNKSTQQLPIATIFTQGLTTDQIPHQETIAYQEIGPIRDFLILHKNDFEKVVTFLLENYDDIPESKILFPAREDLKRNVEQTRDRLIIRYNIYINKLFILKGDIFIFHNLLTSSIYNYYILFKKKFYSLNYTTND